MALAKSWYETNMDVNPLIRWIVATRLREGIAIGLIVASILYVFGFIEDRIQREREIDNIRTYVHEWKERTEQHGEEYTARPVADDPDRPIVYEDTIRLHGHRAAVQDLKELVRWQARHLSGGQTHEILTTLDGTSALVQVLLNEMESYKPKSWPEFMAHLDCAVFEKIHRVDWLRLGDLHLSYTSCDS